MKKFISILSCFVLVELVISLSACSNDDKFTAKNYASGDEIINVVNIDVIDRKIELDISTDNQIHIDYFDGEKEYYYISVENNELIMTLEQNKNWTDFIGTKPSIDYRKIKISVPNNMLSSISITTTNENIKISAISVAQSITLNANGGNIDFENIDANNISISAKNGNINGSIVGTMDEFKITCEIKKGDCNLPYDKTNGEKSLKINCNNGNTNIEFVNN